MDFGDFLTLVFFLIFIVSPFLKRKKAGKKEGGAQDGFSVLGKIRDALKEAAREMEAQARQKGAEDQSGHDSDQIGDMSERQSFWDDIDDRGNGDFYADDEVFQVREKVEPVQEKQLFVSVKKEPLEKKSRLPQRERLNIKSRDSFGQDAIQASCIRSGPKRLPTRPRALQRAVIWSEILGKPVALKN